MSLLAILVTVFFTYLFVTFFGYVVHRSLHQPWMGRFNKMHMTHHLKLYPPSDYYSEEYRDPGKDSTAKFFAFTTLPVFAIVILLAIFGVLSKLVLFVVLVEMVILGWMHDYLHDSFHITNHWLSRTLLIEKLFNYWNKLHFNHHVNMQTNFGIFDFVWDKLFKTFWK